MISIDRPSALGVSADPSSLLGIEWLIASGARFLAILLLALTLPACNLSHPADQWRPDRPTTALERTPHQSGFLGDYSGLRPSPRHADTQYQQSPAFATYDAFIIDPVIVLIDTTARGKELSESDKAELAAEAESELRTALATRFRVVDTTGEGVARVRAAITELAMGGRGPNGEIWLGGAAVELEVVDSVTGQRVAAAVETDSIDPLDEGRTEVQASAFHDAHMVFRHWSQRFARWVDAARTGEMPPTR